MKVGIIEYFDAAHRLPEHPKCEALHGHTYKVELIVEGGINMFGMVIDFGFLKDILKRVIKKLDHQYLNIIIEVPTAENICRYILDEVKKEVFHKQMECSVYDIWGITVRVWEGEGKWAEETTVKEE
jgi:6-pyruvoyltetrahydropterin/6-carboxytetrahydropterin synthase